MKRSYIMQVNKIIEFLETDTISVTFSSNGLKYLSLISNKGDKMTDLKNLDKSEKQDTMILRNLEVIMYVIEINAAWND